MPQVQLPLFPAGVTFINDALACQCQDGQVVYLNGHLPVFTHAQDDLASFRFFTTQLIVNGSATQGQIARAFGVPIITVKRGVKRHRSRGAAAFFTPAPRREGSRLTAEVLAVAQGLLAQGQGVPEVSRQTGVLASTLHKAIRAGRLSRPAKKKIPSSWTSSLRTRLCGWVCTCLRTQMPKFTITLPFSLEFAGNTLTSI